MLVDRARAFLLAAMAALLLSCGGGGGSPGVTGPDAPPLPAPPSAPPTFTLALRQVASGLDNPTFVAAPRGDPRLFIVERAGRIRILQDGLLRAIAFLDISARVSTVGEGGLLSIAFHPQYASNGQYFLYFTDAAGDIVVERRSVSANPNLSDPTSALEIIRIPHPNFRNHYGGLVAFGADGFLYLATGDGGGAGDPARNAQNLGNLLGKMLRLDISAASAGAPYALPLSNPFIGQAGRRGEIWAYGLRNPWRYGFDGGQLYIADVGQDHREEVNIVAASQGGQNYGWNVFEGTLCYDAAACGSTGLTAPFFEYDHGPADANGCSITGGEVYRGAALPELAGRYLYSDYCAGFLKSFMVAGSAVIEPADWRIPDIGRVISFGRDGDGELYLVTAGGVVHKIIRGAAPAS